MKKKKISKKLLFSIILLGVVIPLACYYQPILTEAGRFFAIERLGKADVVILEGTELIREEAVRTGLKLILSGNARRLVVVYQESEDEKIFGRPPDYNLYLIGKLKELGLKADQIIVLGVPKEHPITFTEAQMVLSNISKRGVKSAILLAEDFHTRRSYWTYQKAGSPLGIEIIPCAYFTKYRNENWWEKAEGLREFFWESVKFFYYLARGYIPVKSLLVT